MEIVRKMAKVPCDINDFPRIPINISDCGQQDEARNYLWVIY